MQRYPLSWPDGWKRTSSGNRIRAKFHKFTSGINGGSWKTALSISQATERILKELSSLGVQEGDSIISTNLQVRLDGLPRSAQPEPIDPGAAVYWKSIFDKNTKVMAIDIYDRVADNLAAIAATLYAMRAIERHGGAMILERAFTGFTALPPPKIWRDILGLNGGAITKDELKRIYREMAMKYHPDMPEGSHERMAEINKAYDEGQKELSQ